TARSAHAPEGSVRTAAAVLPVRTARTAAARDRPDRCPPPDGGPARHQDARGVPADGPRPIAERRETRVPAATRESRPPARSERVATERPPGRVDRQRRGLHVSEPAVIRWECS